MYGKNRSSYIIGALRTPVGAYKGELAAVSAIELCSLLVKELSRRYSLRQEQTRLAIFGNVLQAGLGMNPARQAAVMGGFGYEAPAYTVNMVCASGIWSIILADQSVRQRQARVAVAGGFESMSNSLVAYPRVSQGIKAQECPIDLMIRDGLRDPFLDCHMAETVECLSRRFKIAREEQDAFALSSHRKAIEARATRKTDTEIVPTGLMEGHLVTCDERPRDDTTLEKLASLEPVFDESGSITAGNACGLSDGAAAVALSASPKHTDRAFSAEIVESTVVGCDPVEMGLAPALAIKQLLRKCSLRVKDVDLWEINEAFAAQVLLVQREVGIPETRLNVNGGAIAIGHPIGCSGARVLVTLLHEMKRTDAELGVAAVCVGGGMGVSVLVRLLDNG